MPARTHFKFAAGAEPRRPRPRRQSVRPVRRAEAPTEKAARAAAIAAGLANLYGEVECPLSHRNTFDLLIAVMLSAQCTDAAVNKVTPSLFERFSNPAALARASLGEIESLIRTLGLFRAKARSLKRCA